MRGERTSRIDVPHDRLRIVAAALVLAAAAAVVYWPALRAYLEGDDFSLLAFARILRNPLALFAHEHFPLGPYFRPLAMSLWWLTARAFDNAVMPQYAVNLLLHIGVSLALWRLLAGFTRDPRATWAIALLFAVHPLAIGTTLWLADRFDLLATLLSLLALRAACDVRRAFSVRRAAVVFGWLAGAVLSKETGVVAAAVVGLIWIWPGAGDTGDSAARSRRRACLLLLGILAAAWIGWRASVIRANPDSIPHMDVSFVAVLFEGALRWFADFLQYLCAWGRLPPAGRIVLVLGALCVVAAWALARGGSGHATARGGGGRLPLACAAAIVALCAVIHAPFSYLWSVNFATAPDPTSVAAYARLFYFPLCGIAVGIAPVLARVQRSRLDAGSATVAVLLGTGVALMIVSWAFAAHDLANAFRRQSIEKRALIAAAVDAVASADVAAARCRIFLLDVDGHGSGYVLKTMGDAVIKAAAPDVHRIEHCLIQSEQASWANTIGGERMTPALASPLRPMYVDRAPAPWIDVGGVQVAYLNLAADVDARSVPDALFLQQQGGRFRDVSAQVRDGSLRVHFVCARPAQQCN